ncbi:MAG: 4-(cytidine 5'-diphospho)-2-C-methyl-D-erythritol kinase [Porticoccaceae bacterium]|nr:4-(cytidine 5'-diphospho)-2-C-methyl-D-erythritol kinase [Porticoccaceae bacterium]
MKDLKVISPAKINLNLKILGRRNDGYHNIQTLFQILKFGDEMTFSIGSGNKITVDAGQEIENNIVLDAAKLLQEKTSSAIGCHIQINKKIPLGGGMGGGSSNAATTLLVLNHLWKINLSKTELLEMGRRLGADVPIFIIGESALAEGIGEKLRPIVTEKQWFLIINPHISISTHKIFSHPELTRNSLPSKISAILDGRSDNDCTKLVTKLYPEILEVLDWLKNHGKPKLTGTGACIFCSFKSSNEANWVLKDLPEKWSGFVTEGVSVSSVHETLDNLKIGASPSG